MATLVEREITAPLSLTQEQSYALDNHSFLNIINVIVCELEILKHHYGYTEELNALILHALEIAQDLKSSASLDRLRYVQNHTTHFSRQLREILNKEIPTSEEAQSYITNIETIEEVIAVRVEEMLARAHKPDKWTRHSIKTLRDNFYNFFTAIEQNSKGRYGIIYNIAAQEEKDYYVNLDIESVDDPDINMPPVLQDVLRDIIANARKYTQPGGRISAGLHDNGERLSLIVEDNGCGIPEDEIDDVVNFGKRASNALNKPTMGDGFGLTKAYYVAKRFNGRMWIASTLNAGTRIRIQIPRAKAL